MAGRFEGGNLGGKAGIRAAVGRPCIADVNKDAILAVKLGRSDRFAVHRRNAQALLAGGFGDQLLHPGA